MIANIESAEPTQVQAMLEAVSSSSSAESGKNGDMEDLDGKQRISPESLEQLVRFTSGIWNPAQKNYSTVKKEILSIVLCITKFQDDLKNK